MAYRSRLLEKEVRRAVHAFPALILTGPRRSGKTTLLRHVFPHAQYWLMEDPDVISRLRADPRGFLDEVKPPVIFDEIQNVPELLNYVRTRIDARPRRKGLWLFTGSPVLDDVTDSLAGRATTLQLLPFSIQEWGRSSLMNGGFHEALAHPATADLWFRSYLQTYLECDVRRVSYLRDLPTYRRFLALTASRCGQILNKTDLAAPLGLSVPTITEWLNILEITGQILLVPPYFDNFGKRLIKSPKVYFVDTGLVCHLLGIETKRDLERSPFLGAIFESFVASEIVKHQLGHGRRRELYYFRDQQGLEVDFLVPTGAKQLLLLEAKASRTAKPAQADPLLRLKPAIKSYRTQGFVVHQPRKPPTFRPCGLGCRRGGFWIC